MSKYLSLFVSIVFAGVVFSFGCGGGVLDDQSENPDSPAGLVTGAEIVLSSLKDANGVTIDTSGSTGVIPNSFEITISLEGVTNYSLTSDGSLVTTDSGTEVSFGNIGLTCGDITPAISVATLDSASHTYTITVSEAWRYGFMQCTLAITTDEGSAYEADELSYTFQNACAVSDDFNTKTISDEATSCWQIAFGRQWSGDLEGLLTFNTVEGVLEYDSNAPPVPSFSFSKQVDIDQNFEVEIYVSSVTGFSQGQDDGGPSHLTVALDHLAPPFDQDFSYWIGFIGGIGQAGGEQGCTVLTFDRSGEETVMSGYNAVCAEETGYHVRFAKSGDTFTRQYKLEGGEWTDLSLNSGDPVGNFDISGDGITMSLSFTATPGDPSEAAQVGYIKLTTVEGQY